MRWIEVRVTTAPEAAEAMAMQLIELGAHGTATTTSEDAAVVTAHFPDSADAFPMSRIESIVQSVDTAFGRGYQSRLERFAVDDAQWQDAWKEYFKPIRIGRHFVVKPSWEDCQAAPDDIVVEIDPQMAFGTGLHPSTRLCMCALEDRVRPGDILADVGTGSGILAIAAAKLGAGHVDAVDNDTVAVQTAVMNADKNGVRDRVSVTLGAGVPARTDYYDLVVANITAPAVVELAPDVHRSLRAGGVYIASGFSSSSEPHDVESAIGRVGFRIIAHAVENNWHCIHCAKETQQ